MAQLKLHTHQRSPYFILQEVSEQQSGINEQFIDEDGCNLSCCAVLTGSLLMFQWCLLPPSSELELAGTSEMLVSFYQTKRLNYP
jgi:hypothetical protein